MLKKIRRVLILTLVILLFTSSMVVKAENNKTDRPQNLIILKEDVEEGSETVEKYFIKGNADPGSIIEVKKSNGGSYDPKKTYAVGSDGSFSILVPEECKDGEITRAEAATILNRTFERSVNRDGVSKAENIEAISPFIDLTPDH